MSRFLEYSPDQAYLLPPSVKDVLGADHLTFFRAPRGGAHGPEPVRECVQRRRGRVVCPGAAAEGMAVRLCVGDHEWEAFGAAHSGRPGVALSGGRSRAGQLGLERLPAAAGAGLERCFHAREMARERTIGWNRVYAVRNSKPCGGNFAAGPDDKSMSDGKPKGRPSGLHVGWQKQVLTHTLEALLRPRPEFFSSLVMPCR